MKHLLLAILLVLAPQTHSTDVTHSGETYVYICTGPMSKRYHKSPRCRGLDNCSKEIKKVTIGYAKNLGRTPCKWCYK